MQIHRFLPIIGIVIILTFNSCSILQRSDAAKAEKKMESQMKGADKELEGLKKAHYKRQHQETKKMIKKTRRKSDKLNNPKRSKY